MPDIANRLVRPEYAALPLAQRANVDAWEDAMLGIDRAKNKNAEIRRWAARNGHGTGWSFHNIRAKYYGWVRGGRSWTFLVNEAAMPRQRRQPRGLGPACGEYRRKAALGEAFKAYFESHNRAGKPAWKMMLLDLRMGKHIEGVGTWRDVWAWQYPGEPLPEDCPRDWIPRCWRYENMMRKYRPTKFEETAMRKGMAAARQFAPKVHTTRVGLLPGQIYQFDDVWHDVKIAVPGVNTRLMCALEFCGQDVASAHKFAWGMRPQTQQEDGSRAGLKHDDFHALICHTLCNVGYHPDGCVFVIERGTASLKPDEQKEVTRLTGGAVTFRSATPTGRQVLRGMLHGKAGGNFRWKGLLEQSHRLPHYFAGMLPAQTGGNEREKAPEWLYGQEKYAEKAMRVFERAPLDMQKRMWFGGALTVDEFRNFLYGAYDVIYSRTDHKIEGWEQNGWTVGTADGLVRRMSPREVWHAHSKGLARVPHWALTRFLGDKCYYKVRLGHDLKFALQDRKALGNDSKARFLGVAARPDGEEERLVPGAEYGLYVLPHDTTQAVVVDAQTRAVIGMAPAWMAVDPRDTGQIAAQAGLQAKVIALQSAGIRERHAAASDAALVRREETDLILSGLGKPGRKTGRENAEQKKETRDALKALAGAVPQRKGNTDDEW